MEIAPNALRRHEWQWLDKQGLTGALAASGQTLFGLPERTEDLPDQHWLTKSTLHEICASWLPYQSRRKVWELRNHHENSLWLWTATKSISEPQPSSPSPYPAKPCPGRFERGPWQLLKGPLGLFGFSLLHAGPRRLCSLFPDSPSRWNGLSLQYFLRYWQKPPRKSPTHPGSNLSSSSY